MSDAIQVGLTGDDAMAYGFLSRAANAITEASRLARQVRDLEHNVSQLQHQVNNMTDRNATLQNDLDYNRNALEQANRTIGEFSRENRQSKDSIEALQEERDGLSVSLAETLRERDTEVEARKAALFRVGQLEQQLAEATSKLATIQRALGIVEKTAEAVVAEAQQGQSEVNPSSAGEPSTSQHYQEPMTGQQSTTTGPQEGSSQQHDSTNEPQEQSVVGPTGNDEPPPWERPYFERSAE